MKRSQLVLLGSLLAALPLLAESCAVIDSIKTGLASIGRMADGFFGAEMNVVEGEVQGPAQFTYDDGSLRAEYVYKDDKRHGPAVTYFRDGTKESEGTFTDQQRSGRWTYYHPNGRVRSQGSFARDRECGEWIFWSPRGDRTQTGHYDAHGMPSLQWSYWHPGGSIESRGFFLRNERVGLWSYWDTSGELTQELLPLPEGYEVVLEEWPDGSVRREGFLLNGRPHGTWVTRHEGGELRASGSFENGTPHGSWRLHREGGALLALGEMELGRPVGTWNCFGPGGEMPWSAAGMGPPPRFTGEWSPGSIADGGDFGAVLGAWIAEAASQVAVNVAQTEAEPQAPAPSAEQVAETESEPDVPILVQPWTPKQIDDFDSARVAYLEGGAEQAKFSSRYAKRTVRGGEKEGGGSPEEAATYVGKPLPLTRFMSATGTDVDLDAFVKEGKRVVLVVLRGFNGEFCPYCAAQTDAFAESWVSDRIQELGAQVVIVFPGDLEAQVAFQRGYKALARRGRIPTFLRFLYEHDRTVASVMELEGDKVKPATFLVDEGGTVRFAYIGEFAADRPSIDVVLEELEKLDAPGGTR